MIVCVCKGLSHWTIQDMINNGACDTRDILINTGAGSDCGKCYNAIIELIRELKDE